MSCSCHPEVVLDVQRHGTCVSGACPHVRKPTGGGLVICEWCEGQFLREDMDGEHCRQCADQIFAEVEPE